MKSMGKVFKSRWFIALIGIISLSLLIWFVGPLIAIADYKPLLSAWVRMLLIVGLLIAWGGSQIYSLSKARQVDGKLSEGISESNQQTQHHDLAAVKSRFSEAIKILKRAHGGKSGQQYLYQLPWYLLIGPPGSGKTTALVNSGLEFPLEARFGKNSIQGVGGTRHCDWWFTNEAVLIDTAGRYTTQDSHAQADRAEWQGFIALLKKYRRRRPINGVIIAISIADLLQEPALKTEQQIKAVRARLQELIEDLGVQVPVYLVFTKCDLISGFMETFAGFSKEMREQVWGMTLPGDPDQETINYQSWFTEEFQGLVGRLQQQRLSRFYMERDLQRRAKIIDFPYQLQAVQHSLADFIGRTFSESRFYDQFLLRGVYLSSGTQNASALNRAITQLANPLGIQGRAAASLSDRGRSYFLTQLLRDVIFAESELAGANRRHEIVNRWLRAGTFAACIGVLILAGLGFSAGFARNQFHLGELDTLAVTYVDQVDLMTTTALPVTILPVIALHQKMQAVFNEHTKGWRNLGLYQGDKVNKLLAEQQQALSQNLFLATLKNELAANLRANFNNPNQLRDILKTYLMLSDKDNFDANFIAAWFDQHWQNKYFDQPRQLAMLNRELNKLLVDFSFTSIDQDLVAECRELIRRVPLEQQIAASIALQAKQMFAGDYRFSEQLGSDFFRTFQQTSHTIPRLYTYQGYQEVFKPGLAAAVEELADDNWVVGTIHGDLTDLDLAEVQAKVEKRYYETYISQWEKHLYSVSLKEAERLYDIADYIDTLRSGRSPLRGMLEELSLNTQLSLSLVTKEEIEENLQDAQMVARAVNPKATKLARIAKLASRNKFANLPENPTLLVDKRFTEIHEFVAVKGNRPPQIERLLDSLADLQLYIEKIIHSGAPEEAAYQAAVKRFGRRQDVITQLRIAARQYPKPIDRWINDLCLQVWQQVLVNAHRYAATEYRHSVGAIYQRTLSQRYPFQKTADQEASLGDFTQFFKREGVADLFFQEYLQPFVDTSMHPWRLKTLDGHSLAIGRHALRQFEAVEQIRSQYFHAGETLKVSFAVRPVYLDANVSRFELQMMDQRQVYRHGPAQLLSVDWPASDLTTTMAYQFQDYYNATINDSTEGPWSLFRFIDRYPLANTKHGNRYHLTIEKKGKKAVYEVIAASSLSPFSRDLLSNFQLPPVL